MTNLCTTNEGSDAQLLRADFSRIDDCQLEALGGDLTELAADHEQAVALGHQCIGNAIVAAEVDATFMSITPWRIATNSRVWSPPRSWEPEIVFAMRDIFRHVDEHWPRTTAGRHCEGAAAAGRHFLPDRGFASIGYGVPGGIGAQLLRFC